MHNVPSGPAQSEAGITCSRDLVSSVSFSNRSPVKREKLVLQTTPRPIWSALPTLPGKRPRGQVTLEVENVERDIPIWEHKVYRERPALVPEDGPIGVALPDGVPGSGRSIVTAVSLGLLSASVVIRGGNGNGSTPT